MVAEDDRKFLEQFQALQQQLQSILIQKENMKLQNLEIEKAMEELTSSKGAKAYKIVGPVMIQKDIKKLKSELKEKKDNFDLRTKTLEKAEDRITKKLKEMEPRLKKMMNQ
jgi:prefoldin beta subunit